MSRYEVQFRSSGIVAFSASERAICQYWYECNDYGPDIWINTCTNTVEGAWWSDRAEASFKDNIGLDDALSELWACL